MKLPHDDGPESPIRVFLLIQNRLLRDRLNRFLAKQIGFVIVGCGAREDCSAQTLVDSACDVLVLDSLDASWHKSDLKIDASSGIKSLLIGMGNDFAEFLEVVRGGATGYLSKEAPLRDFLSAIRATLRNEVSCPPKMFTVLFETMEQICGTNWQEDEATKENAQLEGKS